MRYLTLSADYGGLSIRDEREGQVSPVDLGLPPDLQRALAEWNDAYQRVIPLDTADRTRAASQIEALDHQGAHLAARLAEACRPAAKVSYYSERLGKLIP